MSYNIPYNPVSSNQFTGWTSLPVKLPQITGLGTLYEMPAGWATNIGLICGRAKGFCGIGTVKKDSSATIWLPDTFVNTPIIDIQLIAPLGWNTFDDMGYDYVTTKPGYTFDIADTILFEADKRQGMYANQRFVFKLKERLDVPIKLFVFNTNNGFSLQHDHTFYSMYGLDPYGPNRYMPPGDFTDRKFDCPFIWHAFGV